MQTRSTKAKEGEALILAFLHASPRNATSPKEKIAVRARELNDGLNEANRIIYGLALSEFRECEARVQQRPRPRVMRGP